MNHNEVYYVICTRALTKTDIYTLFMPNTLVPRGQLFVVRDGGEYRAIWRLTGDVMQQYQKIHKNYYAWERLVKAHTQRVVKNGWDQRIEKRRLK
jgi:hypothetical protein